MVAFYHINYKMHFPFLNVRMFLRVVLLRIFETCYFKLNDIDIDYLSKLNLDGLSNEKPGAPKSLSSLIDSKRRNF